MNLQICEFQSAVKSPLTSKLVALKSYICQNFESNIAIFLGFLFIAVLSYVAGRMSGIHMRYFILRQPVNIPWQKQSSSDLELRMRSLVFFEDQYLNVEVIGSRNC